MFAVVAAGLAAPTSGWAERNTATLEYHRSEDADRCPSERVAREGIAARLGYDPFVDEGERRVRVELEARPESAGYTARIEIESPERSETGVRTLETGQPACDKLARTLMFAVSVAIDPGAASRTERGAPRSGRRAVMAALLRVHDAIDQSDDIQQAVGENRPRRKPAEPNTEANDTPDRSSDRERRKSTLEFRGSLGGGASFGTGPQPSPLLRIGAELAGQKWAVRVGGRSDLPTAVSVGSGQLTTALVAGTFALCGRLEFAFGCARTAVGRIRLTASGFETNRSVAELYAGLGAGVGVEFPVWRRFRWRLEGQLLSAAVRTRAVVDDEVIWETPDLSGAVTTSVVVEF